MAEAWIIDAVRTPRGRGKPGKGALCNVHPQELMAQAMDGLASRTNLVKEDVEDVILGCVTQAGDQGADIARLAILAAGWPLSVTGVSLNRMCGSGLQAVHFGAAMVAAGHHDMVIAGGVESMSRQPIGSEGSSLDGNNPDLRKHHPVVPQGISADIIATLEGFSREDLDRFALASQQRAAAAQAEGRFARSLIPIRGSDNEILLDRDEHPRADTTLEGLASLRPAFEKLGKQPADESGETFDQVAERVYPAASPLQHVHTAGNSSGIVDGASAVLVASATYARAHGLKPRARIRATALAGDEPVIMLTAPGPASKKALAKAGMRVQDIDLWEINEAFAAVPLKTMRDLEIDQDRVNVNGGSIALGHPLGATGAILLGTALDELERIDGQTAVVTLCIGGGMGIACVIERL